MRETILFAEKTPDGKVLYSHFYPHPDVVRLCGSDVIVVKVRVRDLKEGEESTYWAWWDTEDKEFQFIYPWKEGVHICFPYAINLYVERGDGEVVNVAVDELEVVE